MQGIAHLSNQLSGIKLSPPLNGSEGVIGLPDFRVVNGTFIGLPFLKIGADRIPDKFTPGAVLSRVRTETSCDAL
jgi:hypothetical protein